MDVEKLCNHPFDELLRQNDGLWLCKCGAEGILSSNTERKLVFVSQQPQANRAARRRTVRDIMRTVKKAGKQQAKRMDKVAR